jgi:hypothetical protein
MLQFGIAFPPKFWKSAYILDIRLYFGNPPIFWKSASIFINPLYFEQAPIFYVCANILGKRQYFMILLDFVLQIFVYIFSIYLCILCAPIFLAQLF